MNRKVFLLLALSICFYNTAPAQLRCPEAAATKLPWKQTAYAGSNPAAAFMKPVYAEMQRLFPQPPGGLELTYGLFNATGAKQKALANTQATEAYFMVKDIVCENWNGVKKIIPEGETGCWIYVRCNDMDNLMNNYLAATELQYNNTELRMYTGDLRLSKNENGLRGIYVYNDNDEQTFTGWYFAPVERLPVRLVTKKEFAAAYRTRIIKQFDERIASLQKTMAASPGMKKNVEADNHMSPGEKKKVLQSITDGDAAALKVIQDCKAKQEDCMRLTTIMMQAADADKPMQVGYVNPMGYEPERLEVKGKAHYVYMEDPAFFSNSLPKAKPQYAVASIRRQDISPAKTSLINTVESSFNWNVVRSMVGASPEGKALTITTAGNSATGATAGIINTGNGKPQNGIWYSDDFSASTSGLAPKGWTVSDNTAIVKNIAGAPGNWLAAKTTGLFFPDYAVLQLPASFTIEFDLRWNKDISYYSPNLQFHIGAAQYDNTLKRYDRAQVNLNSYTSARMDRVCLWLDPYWNSDGRSGIQVFDNRGGYLYDKSNKATQFYKERNQVHVKLVRNKAQLTVYFNDEQVWDLPDALKETVRWNFFGFGLTNAPNAAPADELFIGNVVLRE